MYDYFYFILFMCGVLDDSDDDDNDEKMILMFCKYMY